MNESNQLFWNVAAPVLAALWMLIAIELLLLRVLDRFRDQIEWVAVQRYRERCFQESLRRGELCIRISRTDPETGAVIERIVPIPPSSEGEADRDEEVTQQ